MNIIMSHIVAILIIVIIVIGSIEIIVVIIMIIAGGMWGVEAIIINCWNCWDNRCCHHTGERVCGGVIGIVVMDVIRHVGVVVEAVC